MLNDKTEKIYYGTAYMDADKTMHYMIDTDYTAISQFIEQCVWENRYPVPIVTLQQKHMNSALDVEENMRMQIHSLYNMTYFQAVKLLSDVAPNDVAYELLKQEIEQLNVFSDSLELQMFESLVYIAAASKVLTIESAQAFLQQLYPIRSQYAQRNGISPEEKPLLYGLIYDGEDGHVHYHVDSDLTQIYRKKWKQESYALLTTTVFYQVPVKAQETYVKQRFAEKMELWSKYSYLKKLKQIKKLPSEITEYDYDRVCDIVRKQCSKTAYNSFLIYGFRWNIKQYF